jgi:hypothetical protein
MSPPRALTFQVVRSQCVVEAKIGQAFAHNNRTNAHESFDDALMADAR